MVEEITEVSGIKHPSIRGVFEWMGIKDGMEIHHDGDLPARSGIGSSSSFTVGLLNAMRALQRLNYTKYQLASDAIYVERDVIGEIVGLQDQIAASYGGMNLIKFNDDETFEVKKVSLSNKTRETLNDHMMLFFTRQQRNAFEVEEKKISRIKENYHRLNGIYELVKEGKSVLDRHRFDPREFGDLLHQSWLMKRDLAEGVSTDLINEAYEIAMRCGAYGGKVLGAGGGGFVLFFAPTEVQQKIKDRLHHFVYVPIHLEDMGSTIALSQPEGL